MFKRYKDLKSLALQWLKQRENNGGNTETNKNHPKNNQGPPKKTGVDSVSSQGSMSKPPVLSAFSELHLLKNPTLSQG